MLRQSLPGRSLVSGFNSSLVDGSPDLPFGRQQHRSTAALHSEGDASTVASIEGSDWAGGDDTFAADHVARSSLRLYGDQPAMVVPPVPPVLPGGASRRGGFSWDSRSRYASDAVAASAVLPSRSMSHGDGRGALSTQSPSRPVSNQHLSTHLGRSRGGEGNG